MSATTKTQSLNTQALPDTPAMASPLAAADSAFVLQNDGYERCRSHLVQRVEHADIGAHPFHHTFVEDIFPPDYYEALRAYMLDCKYGDVIQDRHQDNPAFMNKRFSLVSIQNDVVDCFRNLFNDPIVKHALLTKFYVNPTPALSNSLSIHDEFEFFFTKAGRFQNIHVDIPPKFVSFVFYIPERPVLPIEEERNATILYDDELQPHYKARFKKNSACIFVPHFHSYHGFNSTIDRDVLVMFYVSKSDLENWRSLRQETKDVAPFTGLLDAIEKKLRAYPLKEFPNEAAVQAARSTCLVNAPQGRILAVNEEASRGSTS